MSYTSQPIKNRQAVCRHLSAVIYKYDIPVWCKPLGDTPLSGELFLLYTTQGCHICFIIPNNIQNTKGGKLTNTRDFG